MNCHFSAYLNNSEIIISVPMDRKQNIYFFQHFSISSMISLNKIFWAIKMQVFFCCFKMVQGIDIPLQKHCPLTLANEHLRGVHLTLADPRGIQGCAPPRSKIFHFHAVFGKKKIAK